MTWAPGPPMKPLVPPWLGRAAYLAGVAIVFLASVAYVAEMIVHNRECEARGGVAVYGRCAQPMPAGTSK